MIYGDNVKAIERLQVQFLAYSYLYYKEDISLIPDNQYDNICKWLYNNMKSDDAKKTRFYSLCKDLDQSGSGFYIDNYPQHIRNVALKLKMQNKYKREIDWKELVTLEHEDMFKVIVAGGREFKDYQLLERTMDKILKNKKDKVIVIVSGMAKGADSFGIKYAKRRDYLISEHPADWNTYGLSAGYRRNAEMGEIADACVCFWDGISDGAGHMINIAKDKGLQLRIIEY